MVNPDLEQVTKTTIGNLIEAGVLLPEEAESYTVILETYDLDTLREVLMTSHELREQRNELVQTGY